MNVPSEGFILWLWTYPVRVLSYDYERTQWGFYLMFMNVPSEGFILWLWTYPVRVLSYDYERTQWRFYPMIMNVPSEGFIRNTMPTKLDIYMFTHKRYNLRQYTNIIYTSVSGIGFGMICLTGIVCIYYNVIIAWTLYYLLYSFFPQFHGAHVTTILILMHVTR
jgi:hypothetical protein